jgi:hypothetical protein
MPVSCGVVVMSWPRGKRSRDFLKRLSEKNWVGTVISQNQSINLIQNMLDIFDTVPITSLYDLLTPNLYASE